MEGSYETFQESGTVTSSIHWLHIVKVGKYMSMTESYISILDESLDKKISILDAITELNGQQTALLENTTLDWDALEKLAEQKSELVDKLNAMDEGFQLVYNNVKNELENNRENYSQEIKALQGKIAQIMEKSSHIMAEEERNKEKIKKQLSARRKEITSVKKNSQYAANYYKTMNKLSDEPVFMDKKK